MNPGSRKVARTVGSIIAIPVPGFGLAYARLFNDWTLGIYDYISETMNSVSEVIQHPISFHIGSTDQAILSGEWPIIGRLPFQSKEDAWAPPQATCYVRESDAWTMGGIPRVDHRGEMRVASHQEVAGLDIMTVCPRPEGVVHIIIDRLINGNHDEYKVRS